MPGADYAPSSQDFGIAAKPQHQPKPRPRYSLAELLAQCDFAQPMSSEEREWVDAGPVGLEDI